MMYVDEIITRRPIVSNNGPSRTGAEETSDRERNQVQRRRLRVDAEEPRQDERVGEEDRVVEERLAGHQGQPEQTPPRIVADDVPGDREEAQALALLDDDRLPLRCGQDRVLLPNRRLDVCNHLLGFLRAPMSEQPAWALGDEAPDHDDAEGEDRPDEEAEPPADRLVQAVEQRVREEGPGRGADPPAPVDRERDPAPDAGGNQLVECRVDRRVLAPDAGAGEEPEADEAPVVPGQSRGDGEYEIDAERDREQDLPPGTIGEKAEHECARDRAQ